MEKRHDFSYEKILGGLTDIVSVVYNHVRKENLMIKSLLIQKLLGLLTSRRFWAAASGVLVTLLHEQLGIDVEMAQQIVMVLVSWIVGDSLSKTKLIGSKGVVE